MAKKKRVTYAAAHKLMRDMSLRDIADALQAEVDRGPAARMDLIARYVGRYNRIDGARRLREVVALLTRKGKRDVSSVLAGNNRLRN